MNTGVRKPATMSDFKNVFKRDYFSIFHDRNKYMKRFLFLLTALKRDFEIPRNEIHESYEMETVARSFADFSD